MTALLGYLKLNFVVNFLPNVLNILEVYYTDFNSIPAVTVNFPDCLLEYLDLGVNVTVLYISACKINGLLPLDIAIIITTELAG